MTKHITKLGKGKKELIDRRKHHINISQIWRKQKVKNTCKTSDTHITKLEPKK
jgi:hypothetical protein